MKTSRASFNLLFAGISLMFTMATASAHCDALDGPVVQAARKAIDSNDPRIVLIWVREQDESEVRSVFTKTLAVRKLNSDARELADRFFFETVVRIHRAGEGAAFTGLKPAGEDLSPAIRTADEALREGRIEPLQKFLSSAVNRGVQAHFDAAMRHRDFAPTNVQAGREFVQAYVEYIHCVEALHAQATKRVHGHFAPESAAPRSESHEAEHHTQPH